MKNDDYSSRLSGFYDLGREERFAALRAATGLSDEALDALSGHAGLDSATAAMMVENAVGVFGLPLGVALNFVVNGREVIVPMAIEEPSVIAGASYMAKLVRAGGGFEAEADPPHMIGQVQLLEIADLGAATQAVEAESERLLGILQGMHPAIQDLGGGPQGLEVRPLRQTPRGPMLIVHIIYDTRDAMGANAVNSAAERLASELETLTGGRAHLRILSNLADRRLARARCRVPTQELAFQDYSGAQVRDGIIDAWAFAEADPYRAATHNKGIMNGVDAVVIATGNDWRAVEAGAHAWAAGSGRYKPLSRWWQDEDEDLRGEIELPLALGTVGGATRVHPAAKAALELMRVETAAALTEIVAAVGLAQNLAALRALATEGIQRGHMRLHARQVALAAGASTEQVDRIARQLIEEDAVRPERALELLQQET